MAITCDFISIILYIVWKFHHPWAVVLRVLMLDVSIIWMFRAVRSCIRSSFMRLVICKYMLKKLIFSLTVYLVCMFTNGGHKQFSMVKKYFQGRQAIKQYHCRWVRELNQLENAKYIVMSDSILVRIGTMMKIKIYFYSAVIISNISKLTDIWKIHFQIVIYGLPG